MNVQIGIIHFLPEEVMEFYKVSPSIRGIESIWLLQKPLSLYIFGRN